MSREEAAKANPSEQETGDRQTWLGRLQEVEVEYGFLVDWESRNGALLQEKREFPVQIWNRIRKVRDRLTEIARVAKLVFDDTAKGADRNFWDRFNGMWNGTQKFWDIQQGLLKSKPTQAPSKSQPNHLATPVEGPTGMQIVEFQQSPQGIDVPILSAADLLEYNRKMFNMLGQREVRLHNILGDLHNRLEGVETTNRQESAFRMNQGPTTSGEKKSDRLNADMGGAGKLPP